jgi:hypothetical protein
MWIFRKRDRGGITMEFKKEDIISSENVKLETEIIIKRYNRLAAVSFALSQGEFPPADPSDKIESLTYITVRTGPKECYNSYYYYNDWLEKGLMESCLGTQLTNVIIDKIISKDDDHV